MAIATNNIEKIGLKAHLESSRSRHNDYGYAEFINLLERQVNKVNLARIYRVNRKTIDRWVEVHKKEQSDD